MMREVTAQELAKAFEGILVDVQSVDYDGFSFEMSKGNVEYEEEYNELVFSAGNYIKDGTMAITIKEDWIECIEHDEETDEYFVSFEFGMLNIAVFRHKTLEELEQERAERSQK